MIQILKKRWYIFLLIIIVIGLILSQQTIVKSQPKDNATKFIVKKENLKETLDLSGDINADEHVILSFQSSGRLNWVGVKTGDYVKKYQALASLDQRDIKNRLQKYLNTYSKSRWSFDQTKEDKDIKNIGGLSEDQRRAALRVLDESQFDLNNSVLDVELQNLSLEYGNLFTPIEGLVVNVDSPFAGVNITPSQANFEIINPKTIYFSVTADQSDIINMRAGMVGHITLDAYPEKLIQGTTQLISFIPKAGETGTVYEIKVSMNVDNSDYKYRFGMTGDISFVVKEKNNVLSVPTNYLKTSGSKKYVLKQANDQKIKAFVTIGAEIDSNTIITSGLNEKDVIFDL